MVGEARKCMMAKEGKKSRGEGRFLRQIFLSMQVKAKEEEEDKVRGTRFLKHVAKDHTLLDYDSGFETLDWPSQPDIQRPSPCL